VTKVGGITFADFYPYDLSLPLACDTTKTDFTVTVTGWSELNSEQAMIDYVLNKGTLSVAVDATLWGSYRGGIFSSCTQPIMLNHGVNIVGVNTVERYWIIRNSWGTWWGENGYMRLAMVSSSIRALRTACTCETLCCCDNVIVTNQLRPSLSHPRHVRAQITAGLQLGLDTRKLLLLIQKYYLDIFQRESRLAFLP
jgi:Papain family cysteine protease